MDVVAAVIRDTRGRILLARRTEGRDLAELWEFPGGKREPGETAEGALARELREELGIEIEPGAPVIRVP
ncbi:NUDIX domain-containing protein, partial [Salmonella enterica subsp. enterica serovar Weltevreden]|nr:NUDIX domain-containing protein [Salmonella enterica subsp. enterica serovar Weltevreden]